MGVTLSKGVVTAFKRVTVSNEVVQVVFVGGAPSVAVVAAFVVRTSFGKVVFFGVTLSDGAVTAFVGLTLFEGEDAAFVGAKLFERVVAIISSTRIAAGA